MSDKAWQDFCGSQLLENPFSSGIPNLSICMQHTILVWVPSVFTLLFTPALFIQARRNGKRYEALPYSFLLIVKIVGIPAKRKILQVLSTFLTGINFFVLVHNVVESNYAAEYLYPALLICSYASMTMGHLLRRRYGMVTSGIQHISALIFLIAGIPEFYQRVRQGQDSDKDGHYLSFVLNVTYFCYFSALIIYNLVLCFADPRMKNLKRMYSPELDSSWLNRITLWWFNSLPWIGHKKALEIDDIFEMNEGMTTPYLSKRFDKFWLPRLNEYYERRNNKFDDEEEIPLPSIFKALASMFKWEILYGGFLKFVSDTLQFANPFFLHQMINFVSQPKGPLWQGLSYAILLFVFSEIRSLILNMYNFTMFRMGIKFQMCVTAAVYQKTLKLSNSARREKTIGEIVNLMAIDTEKFFMIVPQFHLFWSSPYQIIVALIYLYLTLGYSAAPGIVIMIIFLPLNIITSVVVKRWQAMQMKLKDERTKMVNEVLNGMKVVKLYAWELPMEDHINEIRKKELHLIRKAGMLKNIIDSFNVISPFLVALFSFSTFVLSSDSHQLTPQVAFVSLSLFNLLRSPMTMIAQLIAAFVQFLVSNERLKSFLIAEELDSSVVEKNMMDRDEFPTKMEDFDAQWENTEIKPTLTGISFQVLRGDLLAVVGKVGSGKSSLLNALLGEMGKLKGRIGVHGKLAYVPQQAWIQNATVKENILFGKPYNRQLYRQVLYSCALLPDLEMLPHGDQTEVGEKGINLSGGQKARLSLARAVYQDFDVYLLDDPLSAVDAHVGKHIFAKVIGPTGILKNKTRIMVTHGLNYTKQADEIIVLDDGRIAERGKYHQLLQSKGVFYQFLEEYKTKGKEEKESSSESSSNHESEEEESVKTIPEPCLKEKEYINQPSIRTIEDLSQKLIKKENIETAGVKMAVYHRYVKAASYLRVALFIFFLCSFMGLQVARNFWLSAWSNQYDQNKIHINDGLYLGVYAGIGTVESSCMIVSLVFLVLSATHASSSLHSPLIHSVMRSPMEFFDTTPMGRILNRCAKDVEVIDGQLPQNFRMMVVSFLQMIFNLIAIIIATPLFAAVIVPLCAAYSVFLKFYVPTARQLRRLESVYRSPIYSHFGETIQGAASLRAYGRVEEFQETSGRLVDRCMRCRYHSLVANRWLSVRLEFLGNLVIFFAALFAVLAKEFGWEDNAGIVGVSISYSLTITDVLNTAVRQMSLVESNIVSVERIEEYIHTKNEPEWEVPSNKPEDGWPIEGRVDMEKYSTRYRAGLDLVLRQISTNVAPGEKIGIVGRTGAGKSSFTLALFRLIEPAEGKITIDGVDVSKIGLHDLRSALTIIPQDPVLFSGTLRFNLDPFDKKEDSEIWQALELAHLKEMASSFEKGLQHHISEGGENISVGQRQLVCLARALLRRTRILVLDEATAAVDVATDALIQTTIREQFKECTVFTIAHRLNTILDYDRIMVLDKGEITEFDSPQALLQNSQSIFSKMVADSHNESSN